MHEEPDLFNSTMRELSLDPIVVKIAIDKRLESHRQQHVGKGFRIAPDTTDLFKRAMERARAQGRKTIEATDIFEALTNYDSLFVEVLKNMGANPETVAQWAYADTGKWDAERNTREFIAAMPEWRRHGLLASNAQAPSSGFAHQRQSGRGSQPPLAVRSVAR